MTSLEAQILAYLKEHPNASDTLEGIAIWWLPGVHSRNGIEEVRQALEHLVSSGLLVARVDSSGRAHYWLKKGQNRNCV
jgi:hypothetical protein